MTILMQDGTKHSGSCSDILRKLRKGSFRRGSLWAYKRGILRRMTHLDGIKRKIPLFPDSCNVINQLMECGDMVEIGKVVWWK